LPLNNSAAVGPGARFYATARARAGMEFNTVLIYGTGGWIGSPPSTTLNTFRRRLQVRMDWRARTRAP